jgi:PleD family two-component response regulator
MYIVFASLKYRTGESFFTNSVLIRQQGLNFQATNILMRIEQMSDKQLILVVDDDTDLVEALAMKLESEDFRVAKAYDGIEGLSRSRLRDLPWLFLM